MLLETEPRETEVVAKARRRKFAISESDELVCFSVYGTAQIGHLQPIFRQYDQTFASRLGLTLFGDADSREEYEIAMILSRDWWDDDAWREVANPSDRAS